MRNFYLGLLVLVAVATASCTIFAARARGDANPSAAAPPSAALVLGDRTILRLYGTIGGQTPKQRIDQITDRLTPILSNAGITPDDIVVYDPAGQPPVIFVLGRRIVTVDPTTAAQEGYGTHPLKLAKLWAAQFEQVLPRICWRPPNAREPVVPADPSVRVTNNIADAGGNTGLVTVYGKLVMVLRGTQPGGLTAAERADLLHTRLQMIAFHTNLTADDVAVLPNPANPSGAVEIDLAQNPIYTVTAEDARLSNSPSAVALATAWAKNLRLALHLDTRPQTPATESSPADEPQSPTPPTSSAPVDPNDIPKRAKAPGANPANPSAGQTPPSTDAGNGSPAPGTGSGSPAQNPSTDNGQNGQTAPATPPAADTVPAN